jgi:AAA domain
VAPFNDITTMQNVLQLLHPAVSASRRGSEVYDAARSASNPAEAHAVKRLVRQLVDQGVRRSDIGIICFFHAQVGSCTVWTVCVQAAALSPGDKSSQFGDVR